MSAAMTDERGSIATLGPSSLTSEEEQLIASARAGDAAAFESLVMPHRNTLLRVTQRILRNREDAEDAVQSAFLDAFRNLNGFQGRSRFSSWLTRIAMNAALMRLRVSRRGRETSLDEVSETGEAETRFHLIETRPNPEQEYLSKEDQILLQKGLKKLGPLYVNVVRLRGIEELSAKETARILELPVGTVKARLHRARAKLTRHMQSFVACKRQRANARRQQIGELMSQRTAEAGARVSIN
jgi:RNA polymerase sigma-70 factor, ECF subfamily